MTSSNPEPLQVVKVDEANEAIPTFSSSVRKFPLLGNGVVRDTSEGETLVFLFTPSEWCYKGPSAWDSLLCCVRVSKYNTQPTIGFVQAACSGRGPLHARRAYIVEDALVFAAT